MLTGPDAPVDLSNTNFRGSIPSSRCSKSRPLRRRWSHYGSFIRLRPITIQINSNSDATIVLKNSHLYDSGDGCIKAFPSSTKLNIDNVEMESCNGIGIWARQVEVEINDITIGENISTGFDFTQLLALLPALRR